MAKVAKIVEFHFSVRVIVDTEDDLSVLRHKAREQVKKDALRLSQDTMTDIYVDLDDPYNPVDDN